MEQTWRKLALSLAITSVLSACGGDDGRDGTNGADGADGADGNDGLNSLTVHTTLSAGDMNCFAGGLRIESGLDSDANGELSAEEVTQSTFVCNPAAINNDMNFNRIATFPVCQQIDATCNTDEETASEIVAASTDGMTLIYSDSPAEQIGFVDITNPAMPMAAGVLALDGEPTSVAVKGDYALVGVNTSEDYVNVSGQLDIVNIASQTAVRSLDLGGQPDSVAVSPDGMYAAVVIENERDEDLGEGVPPQLPAGSFIIVDIADADPANWSTREVDITGLADLFAGDPEPEYVDINSDNIAVVTMQENNHILLIDLADGSVLNSFSAGSVDLDNIDMTEESPAVISQTESASAIVREPDGVAWINTEYFATADEGDMDGGSRGFTVFNTAGDVVWTSGNSLDHMTARFGHYPDYRSENKGNEPENIEMGVFGANRYLFVNSERASMIFVYDVANPAAPMFKQALPAALGPEGGLAIPSRNLLVVASEEDSRGDKFRSSLNIYRYEYADAAYPTVTSVNRDNGAPIPWGAMSGLSADPMAPNTLYAIEDSYYASNRIFAMDVSTMPARIEREITIMDSNDVFAGWTTSGAEEDATSFDDVDLAAMINEDKSVNIDPEGIAKVDGGFWVASEGAGTITDTENRPIQSLNFLFKTDDYGVIEEVVTLPADVNATQVRFGFEGVAEYNGKLYVTLQRAWGDEANPRIGIYDIVGESWTFAYYPLEAASSQNGGWVGLSDISAIGNGEFLVLERDNQGGPDAAIKHIYHVDMNGVMPGDTVVKTLVRDVLPDMKAAGGLPAEKVEGLAYMASGDVWMINDNDGIEDNSGETQLLNLGAIVSE